MAPCFRPLESTSRGSAPWIPTVPELTCVRLSKVLPRNGYGLWDSTMGFEEWRFYQPRDCSLYYFLPVWNVCRDRGRDAGQTVSRRESSQNGCNSRSCNAVPICSCQSREETLVWIGFQERRKILLLMVALTWILATFIYAQCWYMHLLRCHIYTHI